MNRKEQIIFGILGLLISAGGCIAAWLALPIIFPPTPTAETATSSALTAIAGNANLTQTSETAATAQAIGTAQSDADKDGLTYEQELKVGTNPEQPDTDGDELNDGTDPKPIQPAITLGTANHLEPLTTKLNYQLAAAGQLAFSPNGTYLASASSDRDGFPICIWQMSDGTLQKTLFGHSNGIFGVTFSKDGAFVASGAADTSVRVWRVRDGQSLYVLNDAMDLVHDVAFSPTTANTLAAVTAKGVVLLWDVNNGQVSKRLATNIVGYHSLAFQPDGLFIVEGGQTEQYKGQIVVLNLSKGSISQTLNTESAVYDMAFSPNGTLLAAGTVDGKILLYQPGSWTLAGTLTSNGAITALAFSPDGTILATISQQVRGGSKTLQLWDVRRAVPLFTKGDIQGMASIAFSPDGHAIASSYFEGNQAIQFWGIPPIR